MKKIVSALCLMCTLLLFSIPVSAADDFSHGDVDANGTVDTKDARLFLGGLISNETADNLVDLNGDKIINTTDVRTLLDYIIATEPQKEMLFAFKTPVNTSISHEEVENNRIAQIVNTYEEFEAVCAKIRSCFYTPYKDENGSFDTWTQTITPDYFDTKSLFIITKGTDAISFELEYAVSEETIEITINQPDKNSFCRIECWQLIVEINKEDLIGRTPYISFK